ncbi:MAG: tRNA uridine-5-carboxymethylaminomethyl(34) synthesis GTPase MnmE [Dongiaceae bacterium]
MGRAKSEPPVRASGTPASRHGDTIFAPATGAGNMAISVVRISGPKALDAIQLLSGGVVAKPRTLTLCNLHSQRNQVALDHCLVAMFPGPASFTGEDMAELHLHGGRAVLSAVVDELAGIPGLRPADAGEFTRRAFENGKLDLTAAEGIADLINADTEQQRRQALRQLAGALGRLYEGWRERLVRTLARLEAHIDFPEDNLPSELLQEVQGLASGLAREIGTHLADSRRGERLREGVSVAILGAPNSGKSSLLNYLAGRDAAIVSARAGTTRDVVEVRLDLGGYLVDLADTAGLRDAADEIEAEGVRRALQRAEAADINILLFDAAGLPEIDAGTVGLMDKRALPVVSRTDLAAHGWSGKIEGAFPISVSNGQGLPELIAEIQKRVEAIAGAGEAPFLTRARHRHALEEAATALSGALAAEQPELIAEDLRLAVRSIGRITGRVDVEDILDVVFRDFCIGK